MPENTSAESNSTNEAPVHVGPSAWLILVGAISVAAVLWICWTFWGIEAVRAALAPGLPHSAQRVASAASENSTSADTRATHYSEIGQSGDAFGGLNTVLTAVAGALVFWAGYLQYQALKLAQAEARAERAARQKQAADSLQMIQIAERSASHAEAANLLARDAMVASERAWIKVDVRVSGPLTYNVNGANFVFDLELHNIGKSPAQYVFPNIKVELPPPGSVANMDERMVLQSFVNQHVSETSNPWGFTVFPGESVVQTIGLNVSQAELNQAKEVFAGIYPRLFGVVVYRLSVGDTALRYTSFIYELRRQGRERPVSLQKNRARNVIFLDEGEVPQADLQLVSSFVAPGQAS